MISVLLLWTQRNFPANLQKGQQLKGAMAAADTLLPRQAASS